jgi:hypothetical protein
MNRGIIAGKRDSDPKRGTGTGRQIDVFLGRFAEKVVFAEIREKTAHNFIFDFGGGGYSEVSGHSI